MGKIKESVTDFGAIRELYHEINLVLNALGLGSESVRYYAGSVLKPKTFQLPQRTGADRYIHVIAFIAHQHYFLHDALADVLLSVVQTFRNSAQRDHQDQVYQQRQTHSEQVKTGVLHLWTPRKMQDKFWLSGVSLSTVICPASLCGCSEATGPYGSSWIRSKSGMRALGTMQQTGFSDPVSSTVTPY